MTLIFHSSQQLSGALLKLDPVENVTHFEERNNPEIQENIEMQLTDGIAVNPIFEIFQ